MIKLIGIRTLAVITILFTLISCGGGGAGPNDPTANTSTNPGPVVAMPATNTSTNSGPVVAMPTTTAAITVSSQIYAGDPNPIRPLSLFNDGAPETALFGGNSGGLAVDLAGNVYVGDTNNNVIRKVDLVRSVSTLAGNRLDNLTVQDGVGEAAKFFNPNGIATDRAGNVWVADSGNKIIRRVTPQGVVTTVAGRSDRVGSTIRNSNDGQGNLATFTYPNHMVIDSKGNIIVSDILSLRKVTPQGVVTTLAGSLVSVIGSPINRDGSVAAFGEIIAMDIDSEDNIFLIDSNRIELANGDRMKLTTFIRKISPAGVVTTFLARGLASGDFKEFSAIAVHKPSGNIFILDTSGKLQKFNQISESIGSPAFVSWPQVLFSINGEGAGLSGMRFGPDGSIFLMSPRRVVVKLTNVPL